MVIKMIKLKKGMIHVNNLQNLNVTMIKTIKK